MFDRQRLACAEQGEGQESTFPRFRCRAEQAERHRQVAEAERANAAGFRAQAERERAAAGQAQSQAERELKERSARFSRQELQKSIALYHVALERTPEDWQLHHNFGMLCYLTHDYLTAAQNLAVEVQRFPDLLPGRLALGAALASAGKTQEARDQFEEVLRINPGNRQAKQAIAALGSGRR